MSNEKLDALLDIAPDATSVNAIEEAAELITTAPVIEVLDAVPDSNPPAVPSELPKEDTHNADLKSDTDFARDQIKDLIDQSRVAIQGALELAEAGDSPRAYEVVGKLLEVAVNANRELIEVHKTKKDATKDSPAMDPSTGASINIDKAVFIGRASDLLRELQTLKKSQAALAPSKTNAPDA